MTFLDPMAGVVAGAWAVPGLLLLYALRLRRLPLRVSSIRLWRRAERDVQANVPFRLPRLSWLLVLHALIILVLVGAIARPAIIEGSGDVTRVIVVIDHSASMSARDGSGRTRLDRARDEASGVIAKLRRASGARAPRVTVLAAGARTTQRCGFSASPSILADAITGIEPTDAPLDWESLASVLAGLRAEAATEGVAEDGAAHDDSSAPPRPLPPPPAVLLLTDATVPATVRSAGGRRTRVIPIGDGAVNTGVSAFRVVRDSETPSTVRAFVRVVSTDPAATTAPVRLMLDGREVTRGVITLTPLRDAARPERSGSVTLEVARVDSGVMTVSLPGGDALGSDDGASAVLLPPSGARVLIVVPDDDAAETSGMFQRALEAVGVASIRTVDSQEYHSMLALRDRGGSWDSDLVVFDRVTPSRAPPSGSLHIGAPPATEIDVRPGSPTRVLWWDRAHPMMRDVSLDSLTIERPIEALGGDAGPGVVLARGRSGPLITLLDGAHRRVVLWFDPAGGSWSRDVSFVVFVANALASLTLEAERAVGQSFSTGKVIRVRGRAGAEAVEVRGPIRRRVETADAAGQDGRVPIGILARVGVYESTGVERVGRIAVNLLDAPATLRAGRAPAERSADPLTDPVGSGVPLELWPWFVIAATVLLVIEWVAFGLQARV